MRSAIVLGASGSVGAALLDELRRAFPTIVALVRRPLGDPAITDVVVDPMDPPTLERATVDAIAGLTGDVLGFSVLGIGAGTGKLAIAAHRAVDVELNAAFARGLRASQRVAHLAFMSAVGANPHAKETGSGAAGGARYARVKGEAEEAVKRDGPRVVSIFRPAMIIGSQHTPWILAKLLPVFSFVTPARFKSIRTTEIAKAMVASSLEPPPATRVLHYPEMKALQQR